MKQTLIRMLLAAAVVGLAVFLWMWNKPHKDYAAQEADVTLSAAQFYLDFQQNKDSMNLVYAEKVVQLEGVFQEQIDEVTYLLEPGIAIQMQSSGEAMPQPGSMISVKARFLSYDDLMGEVKLDNGVLAP
jgi:hypothetical protein